MYLADYHMHSKYSFDGSEELDTICQTAIRRGLSEIAITDHMDIYTGLPYDEQMNFEVPGGEQHHMDVSGLYAGLVQMKEKYAGQLKVRIGAELGQPQVNPEAAALLSSVLSIIWKKIWMSIIMILPKSMWRKCMIIMWTGC